MIQVGDEVVDADGDAGTVLAIAEGEAAVLYGRMGLHVMPLDELHKTTVDAPEPPLTGAQMAYVLETLEGIVHAKWEESMPMDRATMFALAMLDDGIRTAKEGFRK